MNHSRLRKLVLILLLLVVGFSSRISNAEFLRFNEPGADGASGYYLGAVVFTFVNGGYQSFCSNSNNSVYDYKLPDKPGIYCSGGGGFPDRSIHVEFRDYLYPEGSNTGYALRYATNISFELSVVNGTTTTVTWFNKQLVAIGSKTFRKSGIHNVSLGTARAYRISIGTDGEGLAIDSLRYDLVDRFVDEKVKEQGKDCDGEGNPCSPATGNKYQREVDFGGPNHPLPFVRHYNSLATRDVGFGAGWTTDYHKRLEITDTAITARRADGRGEIWAKNKSTLVADADNKLLLVKSGKSYKITLPDGATETYDSTGRLLSETTSFGQTTTYTYNANGRVQTVTGHFGHSIAFGYDTYGNIISVTDPAGLVYRYTYEGPTNLKSVIYPDNTTRSYHYENGRWAHGLTGITDENGSRFATYAYDTNGRAIRTEHAQTDNGATQERFTFEYVGQTIVTDGLGIQRRYTFSSNLGVRNLISRENLADGKTELRTYDANNNLTCVKDEEARVTTYTYNSTNQRLSMTEGLSGDCATPQTTTATRTTNYQYLTPTLDLPTRIDAPSVSDGNRKVTTIAYTTQNLPATVTTSGYTPAGQAVSRTTGFGYNTLGQVTRIDGPRTDVNDVTTIAYYSCSGGGACGRVQSITNALNQTTTYNTYDAHGRVTEMTDPNGLKTNFIYDPRGRLTSLTTTPPAGQGSPRQTTYSYNNIGSLSQIVTPTGATISYTYDAAHYLRTVTDNLGNKIEYSYDLRGNRTGEKTYDPNGTLVRSLDWAYDIRNRVASLNAPGSLTQQTQDAVGNLTKIVAPNQNAGGSSLATTHEYDALNRLVKTIDTLNGTTVYSYDANDRLKSVTAPNAANTTYTHDDLGRRLSETSPDRGTTTYTHDLAGNITSLTDARGVTMNFTHDALNRLTRVTYPDATLNVTYAYDAGTGCMNGVGRLCAVTDGSGTTQFAYDTYGNVTEHKKTELGVAYSTKYSYDAADRILTLTYPDNRVAAYTRDVIGRITGITWTVNGTVTTISQSRTWRADGLLASQTFGSGLAETRTYDQQGRMTQWVLGGETRSLTYDPNSNLTGQSHQVESRGYVYDTEDRLTEDRLTAGSGTTNTLAYDPNGNRTQINAIAYSFTPNSNRLTQIGGNSLTLDPAGNTIQDQSGNTYAYTDAGTLKEVRNGGILKGTYTYNYLNLRTRKVTGGATTVFHYDLSGRLIAETDGAGTLSRAYLHDDTAPIAQVTRTATDTLVSLHTDALGTPRLATDSNRATVWRYDGNAFGDSTPNEDPDGNGSPTTVNLRFPGQYHDTESGLHYNWHRYYDPRIGRYVTSDPIGLEVGLNSYTYVNNKPLVLKDVLGLMEGFPGNPPYMVPLTVDSPTDAVISNPLNQAIEGEIRAAPVAIKEVCTCLLGVAVSFVAKEAGLKSLEHAAEKIGRHGFAGFLKNYAKPAGLMYSGYGALKCIIPKK